MTSKQLLLKEALQIKELVKRFLIEFSHLYYNDYSSSGIYGVAKFWWTELNPEGKQLQHNIITKLTSFFEKLDVFFVNLPKQSLYKIKNSKRNIKPIIEHSKGTGCYQNSIQEAFAKFEEEFNAILTQLNYLHSDSKEKIILVVDTNSLLSFPNIEKWEFKEFNSFNIYLTPTLFSELDSLKINSRNENVREKAKTIINKVKEYRRRGDLFDGITIIKNKITLYSIAIEPNIENTFSYLNFDNADDRLIATTIEIIRKNLDYIVYLITADINLQNKAIYSSIPFLEPPENN